MLIAILVGSLLLGSFATPSGAVHEETHPVADISLGVVYEEDFQDDNGTWTANDYPDAVRPDPRNPSWAHGAPTSGPGAANSGLNVWATNLGGDANLDECAAIFSPVIDLTGATDANVSFAHWYHTEVSSFRSRAYDAGAVFVTADGGQTLTHVEPTGGYPTDVFWSPTRTCLDGMSFSDDGVFAGESDGWESASVDLSTFDGEVQFVFAYSSRTSNAHPGWYIDDFTVTIDGTTTVQDFESGDGGFTIGTPEPAPLVPLGWSWDEPTTGPGVAEGERLWATNPHGDHGPNECSWTESPPIVLGEDLPNQANVVGRAKMTWDNWFDTAAGVGQGVVQVGLADGSYVNIIPDTGYPGSTRFSKDIHDECLNPGEDEVFAGNHDDAGDAMVEYSADLSQWLGEEVTIRFLFAASDSSRSLDHGWFIDNVRVELRATVYPPVGVDETVAEVTEMLPSGSTPTGWTVGGQDPSWEYGVATSGPEGETVFKTNLHGLDNDDECGWAQSPVIPGALFAADPVLEFDHWYDTYKSSFSGPWGAGIVLVSTDGADWTLLDVDNYGEPISSSIPDECFKDYLGLDYPVAGSFAGESGEFVTSTADLSGFLSEDSVQFRFVYGTGAFTNKDGWALRSVAVGGVALF